MTVSPSRSDERASSHTSRSRRALARAVAEYRAIATRQARGSAGGDEDIAHGPMQTVTIARCPYVVLVTPFQDRAS
jgi:hypothetical protein